MSKGISRVNGISFDNIHTYYDLGLYLARRPKTGEPEPKTSLVEIPGADGILDLTEQNFGEVKYSNRIMIFSMSAMVDADKHQAFRSRIMQALHGKRFDQIILDEDPDWYYSGRATVLFEETQPWKIRCTIHVDAAPYALRTYVTERDFQDIDSKFEAHEIELAKNQKPDAFTSLFMLGTKTFPAGVTYYSTLTLTWPANAKNYAARSVRLWDSTGAWQSFDLKNVPIAEQQFTIQVSSLTIDPSKIYQVKVYGIADCSLSGTQISFECSVWNERKNAIPEWGVVSHSPVHVILNGKGFDLDPGWSIDESVWLSQGWNKIYVVYMGAEAHTTRFRLRYQEGKL